MSVYWERQTLPDSCRMHALNALLGRQVYTWSSFLNMCDLFDQFTSQPKGTSRVFYFGGDDMTLFGFGLRHAKSNFKSIPIFGFTGKQSLPVPMDLLTDAVAAIVYSRDHVWIAKKTQSTGQWLRIDSLSGVTPSPRFADDVSRQGLGLELVFENESAIPDVSAAHEAQAPIAPIPTPHITYPTFLSARARPAITSQRAPPPQPLRPLLIRHPNPSLHSKNMLAMRSQTGYTLFNGRR
jgi:hypothetical protein